MERYGTEELAALLPKAAPDANKYTRGRVMCFAGSGRYPGAACLAAWAASKMGAGYVEVLTEAKAIPVVQSFMPSLVVRDASLVASEDLPGSTPGKPCAYVAGPGYDTAAFAAHEHALDGPAHVSDADNPADARASDSTSHERVLDTLANVGAPVVFDGGMLGLLGRRMMMGESFGGTGFPVILTPHEGEAAKLAAPLEAVGAVGAGLARLIAVEYQAVVVLKGPVTYIDDGSRTFRMGDGTPALAKAGTGDVLAGMIGSLLAQGMDAFDACVLGASLHARAARLAAEDLTETCVTAEDVIEYLPTALKRLRNP